MRISESIHSLRIPFRIPAGEGNHLERSVHAFLVNGKEACLIDAGVSGSRGSLLAMAGEAGKAPGSISTLVLTHSHPDHLGGALEVQRATGCLIAAHPAERAWIEDPGLQARERPVPGFSTLVEGPVKVDRFLDEGDRVGIGGGRSLGVIHTPGHSAGSLSLLLPDEGVLFSGDAIPVKGEIPVYDDPAASLWSIEKLESLDGVKVLLPSWDNPRTGKGIRRAMEEGKEVIRIFHRTVKKAAGAEVDPGRIPGRVAEDLGLSAAALPVISRTVAGHLHELEKGGPEDPRLSPS